jgi:hypothetical protein
VGPKAIKLLVINNNRFNNYFNWFKVANDLDGYNLKLTAALGGYGIFISDKEGDVWVFNH